MIEPVTEYIYENEPCFQLTEVDWVPKKGKSRRYRTFFVMRNDRITKYIEDMGLSKNQKYDPCRILGGVIDDVTGRIWIEHTVAELRGIAEQIKYKQDFDKQLLVQERIHRKRERNGGPLWKRTNNLLKR